MTNPVDQVAVVDDDWARRVAVVEALTDRGFQAFGTPGLAELTLAKTHPALILLRTDGARDMKAQMLFIRDSDALAGIPVVVVGNPDDEAEIMSAFSLGAADFVTTTVQTGELCARVEARLSLHQHRETLEVKHQSLQMVLELTQALSSTLDMHDLLGMVVRRIAEVVEVARVSVVLRGANDPTAYVLAASDDTSLRDLPIRVADYPEIVQVLDTGEPVVIAATSEHPLLRGTLAAERFASSALLPIRCDDRVLGALFLRWEQGGQLPDEQMDLVRAVANATGIALRNATLMQTLRERRDEAEERLEALRRYADFFNSSADGIIVITDEGDVLFCNPAACEITGHTREQLLDGKFEEMLPPDGRTHFTDIQREISGGVFPNNVDLAIRTARGERRVLNVSFSSMVRGKNGVIISLRDVTEERSLARELTKTKQFLQRVIDSSVDAIVSADIRGTVLLFNPAAERIYGFEASEVIGKANVRDMYPVGVANAVMKLIRSDEYGEPGSLNGYETNLLGSDGHNIPVLLSAALIMHRGRPIGSVGVFRDLRDRLHIEQRLAATERQLEAQEKKALIAELAGATAHELNQPLTAVMGYAGLVARQLDDATPRLKQAADAIMRETERMAEIVRKIGKLTKYETKPYVGNAKIIDIDRSMDSDPPVTGM